MLGLEHRNRLPSIGHDGRSAPATIACGGQPHRLAIVDGQLDTVDHDAVGEMALHALGGGLPDCLVYVVVWQQSFSDGFLEFWAAHESLDVLARRQLRREWIDNYWEGWPAAPAPGAVLFEQPWQDVLGVAVARRAGGDGVDRAVSVRLRRCFVRSLANVFAHRRPDALVPLTVVVSTGRPAVTGRLARTGSWAHIRVAPEWLWDVWGAGMALVDNRLVVARRGATLDVVEWRPSGGADDEHLPVVTSSAR